MRVRCCTWKPPAACHTRRGYLPAVQLNSIKGRSWNPEATPLRNRTLRSKSFGRDQRTHYEQMPEKPGISQIIQLISITACAILKELPAYRFHSGYSFNSARLHFFSLSARAWHVPTSEPSFRFPRRGRPESPRPRHVPEKMRFRHGASPGRNDRVRYPRASLVS